MKRTIKGLLSLLVFMCVLSLYNCEKDSVATEVIGEENGQNSFFSKGKLNQYSKLATYVDELKRKQETGAINKNSSLGSTNNFIILENQDVSVYTGASCTTYTIPIHKTNQVANTFSNLVVKFSDTKATKAIIMNYEPSQNYLDALVTNDQAPYSGTARYEAITYDGSLDHLAKGCTTVSITYCDWGGEGTHTAGPNCTPSYMWTVTNIFCDDLNPPPAFINIGDSGTGGNNDSGVPSDNEIVTTPITKSEAQDISEELDDSLGEGNWEFDESVPDDAPNFESIEELEAYLDNLVSGNFTTESSEIEIGQQNTRKDTHTLHFSSFPQAKIVATVKLREPNGLDVLLNGDIINVRTALDGNNTYFDWTQYDSEDPTDSDGPFIHTYSPTNMAIKIEGEMQVGLRIWGNPFKARRLLTISLSYNTITGELNPQSSYWSYTTN